MSLISFFFHGCSEENADAGLSRVPAPVEPGDEIENREHEGSPETQPGTQTALITSLS